MEEEDVRGDRGLSVFRLRAVSRLTLVVRCTEIGSTLFPLRCLVFGLGVVGVALLVFCLVAVGFVFFCCVFLPGGIVALRMKLQWLRMVEQ